RTNDTEHRTVRMSLLVGAPVSRRRVSAPRGAIGVLKLSGGGAAAQVGRPGGTDWLSRRPCPSSSDSVAASLWPRGGVGGLARPHSVERMVRPVLVFALSWGVGVAALGAEPEVAAGRGPDAAGWGADCIEGPRVDPSAGDGSAEDGFGEAPCAEEGCAEEGCAAGAWLVESCGEGASGEASPAEGASGGAAFAGGASAASGAVEGPSSPKAGTSPAPGAEAPRGRSSDGAGSGGPPPSKRATPPPIRATPSPPATSQGA